MRISILKKIYPYLNNNIKNKKWRTLTESELSNLMQEKQIISNCYDVATRHALLSTEKGKELIKKAIKIAKDSQGNTTCKIIFNIGNNKKAYRSISSRNKSLGQLIGSAIGKMIRKNPSQKPLISRLGNFGFQRFQEFNKPSNAFYWYTGIKPIAIGENNLNINLKKDKKKVIEILDKIFDNKQNSCFVVISNFYRSKLNGNKHWHCLPITKVDKIKQQLEIINKRTNKIIQLSYEELINNFKSIVGINL